MKANITRMKDNKYYILYKRHKESYKENIPLYVIYYTAEYNGGIAKEFSNYRQSLGWFNKATKEAKNYEKEIS